MSVPDMLCDGCLVRGRAAGAVEFERVSCFDDEVWMDPEWSGRLHCLLCDASFLHDPAAAGLTVVGGLE